MQLPLIIIVPIMDCKTVLLLAIGEKKNNNSLNPRNSMKKNHRITRITRILSRHRRDKFKLYK